MKSLLDTVSVNYETPEKRNSLLFEAFRGMLDCQVDNGKPIYEVLIERGLFDNISMEDLISCIRDGSRVKSFGDAEEILGSERWNHLLTPDLAFRLYSKDPVVYFDKLIDIDLMETFRLNAREREGIDKIVRYYDDRHGTEWPDKIGNDMHHHIISSSTDPPYATSKGFRLYQSIYRTIGYRDAADLFKNCFNIEKDDIDGWEQQKKIHEEHTFVNRHTNKLKEDQEYRVIVFDCINEKKGEDGFWREQALYDVQNAKIVGKTRYGTKMEGTNNGPLKMIDRREGESDWNDERKSFVLVDEGDFWRFYTERDGGTLNCRGGYFVRIVPNN